MAGPPKSKLERIARLGGLTTRVASSLVGQKLQSAFQASDLAQAARDRVMQANAERIVATVGQLKGAVMKVGQGVALAAEHIDLPPEARAILGKLHDDVEPVPFAQIAATLERELEQPLDQAFAAVDPAPLGTASLGQAHVARLHDGREVVVKVLHDGIDGSVDSDLAALKMVFTAVGVARSRAEMNGIFDEIRARLLEELDYLQEAANLVAFGRRFAGDDRVRIPEVVPERCTERVLTMSRLPGVPLERFVADGSQQAHQRAGVTLAELHHLMSFRHRALHADPHPGNYLFEPDGRVGLLDFGCVKRFDPHWIGAYARTALAAIDGDREETLRGAADAGVWRGGSGPETDDLWAFCDALAGPFRRGVDTLGADSELMGRVVEIGVRLKWARGIRVPADILYLHRSLGGLYTVASQLRPTADWQQVIRPHLQYAVDVAAGRIVEA